MSESAFWPVEQAPHWQKPAVDPALLTRWRQPHDVLAASHLLLRVALHALLITAVVYGLQQPWWPWVIPLIWLHGMAWSFWGWAGYGHELAHGTVFSNRRLNQLLFALSSILSWSNYGYFQKSHRHHHRYTLHPAQDGEGKPDLQLSPAETLWAASIDWPHARRSLTILWDNARNIIRGDWGNYLYPPGSEDRAQVVLAARVVLGAQATLALAFLALGQPTLVLLVNGGAFIATLPNKWLAAAQHHGCAIGSDSVDASARTVLLNPLLAFLYANMNYHVEHHAYPGVRYYHLPALHRATRAQLKPATRGLRGYLKEQARLQGTYQLSNTHKQ